MSAAPFDVVTLLGSVITDLDDDLPDMVAASTDPQALDLAALFVTLSEHADRLREILRDLEDQLGREMVADTAEGHGLRVTRRRTTDRKSWDHESVRRASQRAILRRNGALGAVLVDPETGAQLDVTPQALVAEGQHLYGSKEPLTGQMRALGLDVSEFCETSRGNVRVTVQRLADEATTESGDAA